MYIVERLGERGVERGADDRDDRPLPERLDLDGGQRTLACIGLRAHGEVVRVDLLRRKRDLPPVERAAQLVAADERDGAAVIDAISALRKRVSGANPDSTRTQRDSEKE